MARSAGRSIPSCSPPWKGGARPVVNQQVLLLGLEEVEAHRDNCLISTAQRVEPLAVKPAPPSATAKIMIFHPGG